MGITRRCCVENWSRTTANREFSEHYHWFEPSTSHRKSPASRAFLLLQRATAGEAVARIEARWARSFLWEDLVIALDELPAEDRTREISVAAGTGFVFAKKALAVRDPAGVFARRGQARSACACCSRRSFGCSSRG